jgi:Flp pilus assembly pilin Flp
MHKGRSTRLWRDTRGATAVEYGILTGGVAVTILAGVFVVGGSIGGLFGKVGGFILGDDTGSMRTVLTQDFASDPGGWRGRAQVRSLDRIGTGLSLSGESRNGNALETVSRQFDIPAGSSRAEISFDMSFVDSWDDELAKVYINGTEILAGAYLWSGDAPPSLVPAPVPGMTVDTVLTSSVQAGTWNGGLDGTDVSYRVTISVDDPGDTLQLGFGTTLNQSQTDESLLIGNVELRAAP